MHLKLSTMGKEEEEPRGSHGSTGTSNQSQDRPEYHKRTALKTTNPPKTSTNPINRRANLCALPRRDEPGARTFKRRTMLGSRSLMPIRTTKC